MWPSWRQAARQLLEAPVPRYAPAPIEIDCPLIPVVSTRARAYRTAERFPEIDAWAVPIHRVAGKNGTFWSNDLKDYLGLPADRKLILSTCAPDDYQETLWLQGDSVDYRDHGIDYWFPGHFSIYDDDSRMYQFANAKRQQLHAIASRSQFVWFRLGESIPIEFLEPIRDAANVLISTQQMYSRGNLEILYREVGLADRWFGSETAFFLVGGDRSLGLSASRKRYELHSGWLILADFGKNLDKVKVPDLTKAELAENNLKELWKRVTHRTPDRP